MLAGLIKRIDGATAISVGTPADITAFESSPSRPKAPKADTVFDLSGKTALVTGASGGLGGAIARALHAQGAVVALSGTRREALETLAAELSERVHVTPCDLADPASVETLVPAAEAAWVRSTCWSTTPASRATICSCG